MKHEMGPRQGFWIYEKENLRDIGKFTGSKLATIRDRVNAAIYSDDTPIDDQEALSTLATTENNFNKMSLALTVLNILHMVGAQPHDVKEVSIKQDQFSRQGYWYYEFDWRNKPEGIKIPNHISPIQYRRTRVKDPIPKKIRDEYKKAKQQGNIQVDVDEEGSVQFYKRDGKEVVLIDLKERKTTPSPLSPKGITIKKELVTLMERERMILEVRLKTT